MWAESEEIAEFQDGRRHEIRKEVINEVKCRKITECATYEEFKDNVAAAFLKPINLRKKPDEKPDSVKENTVHNRNISSHLEKERTDAVCSKLAKDLTDMSVDELKCPKNIFEFETHWRRACKTSKTRVAYLRKIPPKSYREIFKVNGSLTMLGDMLVSLAEERKSQGVEYDNFIVQTLMGLSKVKGIDMAVAFLDDESETCKSLLQDLKKLSSDDRTYTSEDIEVLEDIFC